MKTKLTLLKNTLLIGCAMFALTSCSNDDGADLSYTTQECAGTFIGSLTIREHGTGVNENWYNGLTSAYSEQNVVVTALTATQLKYSASVVPEKASSTGYSFDVTVDYAGVGPDMKYFESKGAFTVDSLKDDGTTHTYTTYNNCDVVAHAKPLGIRLEMVCNVAGATKGGALYYSAWRKEAADQ